MTQILDSLSVNPAQLVLVAAFGLSLGMSKMGLVGMTIPFIPFLATAFGARFTSGLIAPLLLVADMPAVIAYRRTRDWNLVLRTYAWIMVGILVGALVGGSVPERTFRLILAGVLLLLVAVMLLLEIRGRRLTLPGTPLVTGPIGATAGFASMLGNAAGPIVSLFLLAKRLDKQHFLGSLTTVFLLVNISKLPLHIFYWETVTVRSLSIDAIAVPFILLGAFAGRQLVKIIPERIFRYVIIGFVFAGVIRLFIG